MHPPSSPRHRRPSTVSEVELPTGRGELFALTRALVFTKEAYRTLRRPRPTAPAPATPLVLDFKSTAAALTPWDLMDEEASDAGITFTFFQQRSERLLSPRAA